MDEAGRGSSSWPHKRPTSARRRAERAAFVRRRAIVAVAVVAAAGAAAALVFGGNPPEVSRRDVRGSPAWSLDHYGDPDAKGFRRRFITEIDFLGRTLFVHRGAARHFLRLERLFLARAPLYAAGVAAGEVDDWSYLNREVRGGRTKSNHAFGIAIDINALANPLGSSGDMPPEVVRQWEVEGGEWGGDWSRPDPMHFETHLTPDEISRRYRRDGTPRAWYLDRLIGG